MSRIVSGCMARWYLLLGAALMAVILFTMSDDSYAQAIGAPVGQGWTDCSQSMYVANEGNGGGGTTVMEVDCYGTVSTFGTGFGGAAGVVTDGEYLWVSDDGTGTPTNWIHRLDSSGAKTSVSVSLGNPNGLSIDSSGRLLVADANGSIRRLTIDDTGAVTNNELLANGLPMTQGVMGEVDGNVLFVDNTGSIYRITPSMALPVGPSTPGLALGVGAVASGNQGHIALDASGNIYTSNSGARIIRVNPDGTIARDVVNIPDASACDPTQAGMGGGQPAFRGITFTPDWDLVATGYCLDNVYIFPKSDIDGAWSSSTPIATLPAPFVQNPSGAPDGPDFNGPFGVVFAALPLTCQGVTPTDIGTSGNDVIIGTAGNDVILALGGDDIVLGMGGNDLICLGDGDDFSDGGPGRDRIWGGNGEDMLRGGLGNDRLYGGNHDDMLKGGKGSDRLWGGNGSDTLVGGKGNDRLYGNKGDDVLLGRAGNDKHYCAAGKDFADGGPGQDTKVGCEKFQNFP